MKKTQNAPENGHMDIDPGEISIRITEIEAILENDLYDGLAEAYELMQEKSDLEVLLAQRGERTPKKYDIYCQFDAKKHAETYINYLEILILESGEVVYAVPSHQRKAEQVICQAKGITMDELKKMAPQEYYFDYHTWLCMEGKLVMVWTNRIAYDELNMKQKSTLRKLKMAGLYKGVLPND